MVDSFKATTTESRGDSVVVRAEGRLDAKTAPRLLEHCVEARPAGIHLVLNLAEVTFLSSSGVGMLLVLAERTRSEGCSLRIAAPSVAVTGPLELLNLHRFLTIDESEGESLRALGA
ncbi:MAG TPA: STAS domain-containing protein [Candidatus Eisenbacteria bacterium]|nr:STAS domain-containing protein [Candidatus Eisenbacteria bacterium]